VRERAGGERLGARAAGGGTLRGAAALVARRPAAGKGRFAAACNAPRGESHRRSYHSEGGQDLFAVRERLDGGSPRIDTPSAISVSAC
jgi:hypothetical protein